MLAKSKPATVAANILQLNQPFPLFRGGILPHAEIAYETWGQLAKTKDNAVLIFTGLSPSAHAASSADDPSEGWWEYMVGPNKPIDTNRFFVVCINSLGSCFGSSGPASVNPDTGQPYRLDFPELSVEDIASAGCEVIKTLGIEQLHTVIGASLGGMGALAYAIMFPDLVRNLVSISAAAHSLPFAISIRSLQREIIRNDPEWNDGNYDPCSPPINGMRLARKLGLITYRSAEEFSQRFGRKRKFKEQPISPPFAAEFDVESYLDYNANNFIGQFDTNCYLYLSRAIDWFDVAAHGGSVEAGLAKIKTESNLIVGVRSDFLFPIAQQKEIADILKHNNLETTFAALDSIQGHDSFLIDQENFAPTIREFFGE